MKDKLEVIHQECGNIAYYCTDRKYHALEIPKSSDFFRPDGTQCEPYEVQKCYSCNRDVEFSLDEESNVITALTTNHG